MLRSLRIQNLILIEKAEVKFDPKLNIITGETGAGKSALLTAIRLIAGERAESEFIGKWGDLAVVEAETSVGTIRRELHRSGKNRIFQNDSLISLGEQRALIGSLLELVDQSSASSLKETEAQLTLLDTFSDTLTLRETLATSYKEERALEERKKALAQEKEDRDRLLEWAEKDLGLLESAPWEEEEKLKEEHTLLCHGEEIGQKIAGVEMSLSEGNIAVTLKRSAHILESLLRWDSSLASIANSLKSAALEIEEGARELSLRLGKIEVSPQRRIEIETKMGAIEQVKRRFGRSKEEIVAKKGKLQEEIERLQHLDEVEAEIGTELAAIQEKNQKIARLLKEKREEGARSLSGQIQGELKDLNLPFARFAIGGDFTFLFSANGSVEPAPLAECASGGELSRLLLAIKIRLAEKGKRSTLVFDEIDSNVGGQSAAILGVKLQRLAETKQVIAVTHFVQVARLATEHLLVYKKETQEEASTHIRLLEGTGKESEYQRMVGLTDRLK